MKMQNKAYRKRLRHIVLGAAALAGGAWLLGAAPSSVLASEGGSVGGEAMGFAINVVQC